MQQHFNISNKINNYGLRGRWNCCSLLMEAMVQKRLGITTLHQPTPLYIIVHHLTSLYITLHHLLGIFIFPPLTNKNKKYHLTSLYITLHIPHYTTSHYITIPHAIILRHSASSTITQIHPTSPYTTLRHPQSP